MSLGPWPLARCSNESYRLELRLEAGVTGALGSGWACRGIAVWAHARASGVVASIIEKDFAFSGYVELAGESFVNQKLVGLDPLLLQHGRDTGMNLAADSDSVPVAFDQGKLGLIIGILAIAGLGTGFAGISRIGLAEGPELGEWHDAVGVGDHSLFAVEQ